jgi:hypothetical protein
MVFSVQSVQIAAHATMEYVMSFLSNNCTATEERCFLRSPCRDVRELLRFSRCELLLLEVGRCVRGQFGNPEGGERLPLEAATKKRQ